MDALVALLLILFAFSGIAAAAKAWLDRPRSDVQEITGSMQHTVSGTMRYEVTGGYTVRHEVAGTARVVHELAQEDRDRIDRLQTPVQVQGNQYGRLSQ